MRGDIKAFLADRLKPDELKLLYKSYDIVGEIAIIRFPKVLQKRRQIIAEAIMQIQKHIKTVLYQAGPVSRDLRLRKLKWIAGERKTETTHREHGCVFKVDLERCYFSPRLSYERMRISKHVQPNEVIVNMFSGVGCYSILMAKHSEAKKIYSIDINSVAIEYMQENIRLNKVEGRVVPILGDAKIVIEKKLRNASNRVLMPLPEKAYEYLDCAVSTLKPVAGWIHYYAFEHAKKHENPIEKVKAKVFGKLQKLSVGFEVPFSRVVRTTGPNWYQVVVDILVKKSF